MRRSLALAFIGLYLAASARAAFVERAAPSVAVMSVPASSARIPPLSLSSLAPIGQAPALLAAPLAGPPQAAPAAAAAVPAAASLAEEMARDADAAGRPFKTIEWKDGVDPGGMGDRDPRRIYRVVGGPDARARLLQGDRAREIREGERLIYVMLADGTMEAGEPSVNGLNFDGERGVKHMQIAASREVVFAGELHRREGRLQIDLNSGGFSMYGLDPRWEYTAQNTAMLKRYAEKILREPVSVPTP